MRGIGSTRPRLSKRRRTWLVASAKGCREALWLASRLSQAVSEIETLANAIHAKLLSNSGIGTRGVHDRLILSE
jgi:hypothetical protein